MAEGSNELTEADAAWMATAGSWDTAELAAPATAIGWPTLSGMTELFGRAGLVGLCALVIAGFFHALATLYAAAPLSRLVPVSAPHVESVAFVDGGVVVDKLFALFRDHLGALWETQADEAATATTAPAAIPVPLHPEHAVGEGSPPPMPFAPETAPSFESAAGEVSPGAPAQTASRSWSDAVSSAGSVLTSASALVTGAAAAVAAAVAAPARGPAASFALETLAGRRVGSYAPRPGASDLPADIIVAEKVVWAVGSIIDLSLALHKAVSSQGFGVLVRAKLRVVNPTGLPMRLQKTVFKLQVCSAAWENKRFHSVSHLLFLRAGGHDAGEQ